MRASVSVTRSVGVFIAVRMVIAVGVLVAVGVLTVRVGAYPWWWVFVQVSECARGGGCTGAGE